MAKSSDPKTPPPLPQKPAPRGLKRILALDFAINMAAAAMSEPVGCIGCGCLAAFVVGGLAMLTGYYWLS